MSRKIVYALIPIGTFMSMADLRRSNREKGFHFFSTSTMRYFGSRAHSALYSGCVFVTSDKMPEHRQPTTRRYTVRVALDDTTIQTHFEFQEFGSRYSAHRAAKELGANLRRLETLFGTLHKTDAEENEFCSIANQIELDEVSWSEIGNLEQRRRNVSNN